jgi:hypothetical protein
MSTLAEVQSEVLKMTGDEIRELSDGNHSYKELYEYRKVYNALLFSMWANEDMYRVHKSKKHGDGELCFGGGWFIVMATTRFGQISNHYRLEDWDIFRCDEREQADVWDGHTPEIALLRLKKLLGG